MMFGSVTSSAGFGTTSSFMFGQATSTQQTNNVVGQNSAPGIFIYVKRGLALLMGY